MGIRVLPENGPSEVVPGMHGRCRVSTTEDKSAAVRRWLTISLFRSGQSSRAGLIVKRAGLGSDSRLVERVADFLFQDPGERRTAIDVARARADRALARAAQAGYCLVTLDDDRYPAWLREIPDPPPVLWAQGDVRVLAEPAVAVVGSRAALPSSLAVARRLGRELAEAGLVVVSGLARGVDGAAHEGALDASGGDGRTIAVLGSGLDVVYPSEHRPLAQRISASGVVISELPPEARALKHHFPLRNRLISGLSRAVVVVEASEQSGSLITAELAADQGRDVLAVPGGILSGCHRGSHALIKDGARLVETVEDVLEEIRWTRSKAVPTGATSHPMLLSTVEAAMAAGELYSADELALRVGRPLAEMLAEISTLELTGRVTRHAGGRFMRLPAEKAS
jgi:DNA processing protein